jgi:hypothetical protein
MRGNCVSPDFNRNQQGDEKRIEDGQLQGARSGATEKTLVSVKTNL